MKISFREKVLLVIFIIAAAGAAYFYFYWQPVSAEINGMRNVIAEREAEIDVLTQSMMAWSSFKAESEKNEGKWKLLDSKIPDSFDQSAVIKAVEGITSQYAEDVSMKFEEADTGYSSMIIHPVTITLNARYGDIAAMLKLFSSQGTACRITKLDLQELNASTGSYSASFVLEYPEKAPPPAPEALPADDDTVGEN